MRIARSGGIVAVFALLIGCAGPQADGLTDLGQMGDRGIVVLSVTHDEDTGSRASTMFYMDRSSVSANGYERVLRSHATPDDPRRATPRDENGSVYVLSVVPGPHEIAGWQTTSGPLRLLPETQPPSLKFAVAAGEVIYIGNLHMVNVLGRPSLVSPWVPVGGTPEVRDRGALDVPIAEIKAPAIKGKVVSRLLPVGGWGEPDAGTKRNDEPFRLPAPLPPKK